MKVFVFDTETTGLPTERNPSIMDTEKWPHIVQLSYIVYDTEEQKIIKCVDDIIKIDLAKVTISNESIAIHGITPAMTLEKGVLLFNALTAFNKELVNADLVVGHNLSFDKRMIMVECMRQNIWQKFTTKSVRKEEYCTMRNSTDLCRIEVITDKGEKYFKFPTLTQLHTHLFPAGTLPQNLHNALVDVLVCLKCYAAIEHKQEVDINAFLERK